MRYDLVVVGGEIEARHAALAAAALDQRVALVEPHELGPGGEWRPAGKWPTRWLREAVARVLEIPGSPVLHRAPSAANLPRRRAGKVSPRTDRELRLAIMRAVRGQLESIARCDVAVLQEQLDARGVDLLRGTARFTSPHRLSVVTLEGEARLEAERFVIACGTRPTRPTGFAFDGQRVFVPEDIRRLESIPGVLLVVGGGWLGIELGLAFARLGVQVSVLDAGAFHRDGLMGGQAQGMLDEVEELGIDQHWGVDAIAVEPTAGNRLRVLLETGRSLIFESVLYTAKRIGATAGLGLELAGLELDERGQIWCDDWGRTWAPALSAMGEVVGFPPRAGSILDQAQECVCHALGLEEYAEVRAGFRLSPRAQPPLRHVQEPVGRPRMRPTTKASGGRRVSAAYRPGGGPRTRSTLP
ncbi:MAG: FAD-dependent oxidoreductase [Planctomycetales bacterium]